MVRRVGVNVAPDEFAIMAIDPGGTTGVAAGVFRRQATLKATLKRAVRRRMIWATVCDDRTEIQAHRLARSWTDFRYRATVELGVHERYVYLLIEDFNLRQMAVDLVPVEVFAGLRALQYRPRELNHGLVTGWTDDVPEGKLIRPSASEAKTLATNERLRLWGLWDVTRGRGFGDHARDATRHVVLGVSKCLEGRWS